MNPLFPAPDELAPPILSPSSTSILLLWLPPEVPNGFIQGYNVFQDNVQIDSVAGTNYTSEGLLPDTDYTFFIEAFNSAGSTRSAVATGRTLEGVPSGIGPPLLTAAGTDTIVATWTPPATLNGNITRYELVLVLEEGETIVFSGLALTAVVSDLSPFTSYGFLVRACTMGGCGSSPLSRVQTLEAPPTFQMQPNVSMLSGMSLLIEWEEPLEPNGVVMEYVVRLRGAPFTDNGVFLGNVTGTVRSFTASGLQPFTVYEFSIVSFTAGGGTQSEWSPGLTGEAGAQHVSYSGTSERCHYYQSVVAIIYCVG